MAKSERLEKELDRINLLSIMEKLEKRGFKEQSVKKAFMRGSISKELAPVLEEYTSVSALFWMLPDIYKTNGERR